MAELARSAWGGGDVQVDLQDYCAGDSDTALGGRVIVHDVGRSNGPIKDKLRKYDIILDSGAGDSFTDIYGLKRLCIMLYAQRTAHRLGIPVVMGPQTIGPPFNRTISRRLASRALRTMSIVVTRDPRSAECAQSLGRKVDATSTDVVFALAEPPRRGEIRDVIVNISGLLWSGSRHVNSAKKYRNEIIRLVAGLQDRGGREVTLLAHDVFFPGHPDDDVLAIQEFQSEYGKELEVVTPTSLEQIRSLLGSANLLIGSRLHACLNALSSGTPAIGWAYSRKFALMNDLGWEYVIDLNDSAASPASETLDLTATISQSELDKSALTVRNCARKRLDSAVLALRKVDVAR